MPARARSALSSGLAGPVGSIRQSWWRPGRLCVVGGLAESTFGCVARSRVEAQEETRRKILDAAHREFSERRVGDVSVQAIATRAGNTKGAVYSNFEPTTSSTDSTSTETTTSSSTTTAQTSTSTTEASSTTETTEPQGSFAITYLCGNGDTGSADIPTEDIDEIDDIVNSTDLCETLGGLTEITFAAPCQSGDRVWPVGATDGELPDFASIDFCEDET